VEQNTQQSPDLGFSFVRSRAFIEELTGIVGMVPFCNGAMRIIVD
jgi:hypothetical protein